MLQQSVYCLIIGSVFHGMCVQTDRRDVSKLEFSVPFQHKYGYIRDEQTGCKLTDGVAIAISRFDLCYADVR